jgi:hypothetical protein
VIHYHGTPITPRHELQKMAGLHFCVSFAAPSDAEWCLSHAQSIMWDNGAFSIWKSGKQIDLMKFASWVEPRLGHPHWAIVPDVIGGAIDDNLKMIAEWSLRRELSAVVWHLDEPIDHLLRMSDMGFGKVCFGSTERYDPVGSEAWARRADEAFNALAKRGPLPWVHMLRGLALAGTRWPFASADSTNVARNFKNIGERVCPEAMARAIDARQNPIRWHLQPEQQDMFNAA